LADVIGDSSNGNDDFGVEIAGVRGLLDDPGQREGGTVDLRLEKALEDNLVL